MTDIYTYLTQYIYPEYVLLLIFFTEIIKIYVPRFNNVQPKWITLVAAIVIAAALFMVKNVNGVPVDHIKTILSLGAATVLYDYGYKPISVVIINNKDAIVEKIKGLFNLK